MFKFDIGLNFNLLQRGVKEKVSITPYILGVAMSRQVRNCKSCSSRRGGSIDEEDESDCLGFASLKLGQHQYQQQQQQQQQEQQQQHNQAQLGEEDGCLSYTTLQPVQPVQPPRPLFPSIQSILQVTSGNND